MSELGLFPLGIVLLPSEQIPLHIFEDRYQELIELTGAEVQEPRLDVAQLSFELAGRFEFAPELKQRLLQLTSERRRMKLLAELLSGAATAVVREREIAERAA